MISEARTFAGSSGCGGAAGVTSAYGDGVVLQAASAEHATATSGQAKRRIPIRYLPSLRSAASGAKTPSLRTDPHSNRLVNAPATPVAGSEPRSGPRDPGSIGARIGPGQGGYEATRRLEPASADRGRRFPAFSPVPRTRSSHSRAPSPIANFGIGTLAPARVPERRVDLDVETARRRRVEIGIGAKAAGMDAVDGAEVVDLVDVAGDTECAHDLAGRIADQLAAAFEEQRPV